MFELNSKLYDERELKKTESGIYIIEKKILLPEDYETKSFIETKDVSSDFKTFKIF